MWRVGREKYREWPLVTAGGGIFEQVPVDRPLQMGVKMRFRFLNGKECVIAAVLRN